MNEYDPKKIEDWVVGSGGFWRKGDVNTHRWLVPFTGTWEQVRDRSIKMQELFMRHSEERASLTKEQTEELKEFFPDA